MSSASSQNMSTACDSRPFCWMPLRISTPLMSTAPMIGPDLFRYPHVALHMRASLQTSCSSTKPQPAAPPVRMATEGKTKTLQSMPCNQCSGQHCQTSILTHTCVWRFRAGGVYLPLFRRVCYNHPQPLALSTLHNPQRVHKAPCRGERLGEQRGELARQLRGTYLVL